MWMPFLGHCETRTSSVRWTSLWSVLGNRPRSPYSRLGCSPMCTCTAARSRVSRVCKATEGTQSECHGGGLMAYDDGLAGRVQIALAGQTAVSARKMFGGLAFFCRGNMLCGVVGHRLMVRVGPE